jgi:hypothetical protein
MGDSAYDFGRVVWPVIKHEIAGTELVPIEGHDSRLRKLFDQLAGVDFVCRTYRGNREHLNSLASRIQWLERNQPDYGTFTLRMTRRTGTETEIPKRLRALAENEMLPDYTVHAYINLPRRVGALIVAYIVKTAQLFAFIRDNLDWIKKKKNPSDGNEFLAVSVWRLREKGIEVKARTPAQFCARCGLSIFALGDLRPTKGGPMCLPCALKQQEEDDRQRWDPYMAKMMPTPKIERIPDGPYKGFSRKVNECLRDPVRQQKVYDEAIRFKDG